MWVLDAHDGTSAKHHLVFSEGACLVREDVLNLSQVLRDVECFTLHATVCPLIIQVNVISDEEDLADLHQLDGHIQGDRNQHLQKRRQKETREKDENKK